MYYYLYTKEAIQKVKNICAYLLCCSPSLVSDVQRDVEKLRMQLYVGLSNVVSAERTVATPLPIENPAECEVRGVIRFLQAEEILD